MPALLPPRRCPWTWPASLAGAVCLLLVLLLLPASWWDRLWPGRLPAASREAGATRASLRLVELIVQPPADIAPRLESAIEPEPEPPLADWWQTAWLSGDRDVALGVRRLVLAAPDSLG